MKRSAKYKKKQCRNVKFTQNILYISLYLQMTCDRDIVLRVLWRMYM